MGRPTCLSPSNLKGDHDFQDVMMASLFYPVAYLFPSVGDNLPVFMAMSMGNLYVPVTVLVHGNGVS